MPRPRCESWQYFDKQDDSGKYICLLCHRSIASKEGPSNLTRHLKLQHPDRANVSINNQPSEDAEQEEGEMIAEILVNSSQIGPLPVGKKAKAYCYFEQPQDGSGRYICRLCHKSIASKDGPSNLKRHLRLQHPDWEECDIAGKMISDPPSSPIAVVPAVKQRTSLVWKYFKPDGSGDLGKYVCTLCEKTVSAKSRSSNLVAHLRKVHPNLYAEADDDVEPEYIEEIEISHNHPEEDDLDEVIENMNRSNAEREPEVEESNMNEEIVMDIPSSPVGPLHAGKSSIAWLYFKPQGSDDSGRYNCTICKKTFVAKYGPSNLMRHLAKDHPSYVGIPTEDVEEQPEQEREVAPSAAGKPKRSTAWQYFTDLENDDTCKYACNLCQKTIVAKNGPSNLMRHLRLQHDIIIDSVQTKDEKQVKEEMVVDAPSFRLESVPSSRTSVAWQYFKPRGSRDSGLYSCKFCKKTLVAKTNASSLMRHLKKQHSNHRLKSPNHEKCKRSPAWQFFKRSEGVASWKFDCILCEQQVASKNGPSNLLRHLKLKHEDRIDYMYNNPPTYVPNDSWSADDCDDDLPADCDDNLSADDLEADDDSEMVEDVLADDLPDASSPDDRSQCAKADRQLLKLMTKFYLPFEMVGSAEFKSLTKCLNANYKPLDRRTFSNDYTTIVYEEVKAKVRAELKKADSVAIAAEHWTSLANDSYMSITVHFINTECVMRSHFLECRPITDSPTTENFYATVKEMCVDWGIWEKLISITTDNTPDMVAAVSLMDKIIHIPCLAHSLNQLVQVAVRDVKATRMRIQSVTEFFQRNPQAADRLKTAQGQLGLPQSKLKMDLDNRLNSTLRMFQRAISCMSALNLCIAEHYPELGIFEEEEISVVTRTAQILSIFDSITRVMCSQTVMPISQVIMTLEEINEEMRKTYSEEDPLVIQNMCETIATEMMNWFGVILAEKHYGLSTLLDPRMKEHGFQSDKKAKHMMDILKSECEAIRVQEQVAEASSEPSEKETIFKHFAARTQNRRKNVESISSELGRYFGEGLLPLDEDPLKWWRGGQGFPRLYKLMKRLLCVPATAIPAERIFMRTGQTITEGRGRLSGDEVAKLTFLHYNLEHF